MPDITIAEKISAINAKIARIESLIEEKGLDEDLLQLNKERISGLNERLRQLALDFLYQEKTIIVVAFSGGKDSVAMVLDLLFKYKVPAERIELWHHEVDGGGENLWDWVCTRDYCRAFAAAFGLKIFFSWREGGITKEINKENGYLGNVFYEATSGELVELKTDTSRKANTRLKFPAVSASLITRWCSGLVKISVMSRVLTNDLRFKSADILILTGERRQESRNRAKYSELEIHPSKTKNRTALTWRSVIDHTEKDIWKLFERHRVQPHPSYMLGWSRCSCQTCIFNSPNTWATLAEVSPEKVEAIARIENSIDFTLYDKKGIYAKVQSGKSFLHKLAESERRYWIEQATVKYTAPIIISDNKEWVLPLGAKSNEVAGAL